MFELIGLYMYTKSGYELKNRLVQEIANTTKYLPTTRYGYVCLEIINKFNTKIHLVGTFNGENFSSIVVLPKYGMPQIVYLTDSIRYTTCKESLHKLSFFINYEEMLIDTLIKYLANYS